MTITGRTSCVVHWTVWEEEVTVVVLVVVEGHPNQVEVPSTFTRQLSLPLGRSILFALHLSEAPAGHCCR